MSVRTELRRMLQSGEMIVAPGGYDALTTKIIEHLGFRAAYMGGWMTGAHLCTTEPLTTLTEQVANASWSVRAINIPLIVDAGAGFGDAVHTTRTVREFEYAGVAAIHIEDQVYPKRMHYHKGIEHVIPLEEFTGKMKAALSARVDKDFLVIARTDGRWAEGGSFEEVVRRGRACAETGVDVLMPMLRDPKEMEQYRKAVPDTPLLALTGFNGLSVKEIESLGYQIILYPGPPILAASHAILSVYRELKETGRIQFDEQVAASTRAVVQDILNFERLYEIERATTEKIS